jgi:hypothetical protein
LRPHAAFHWERLLKMPLGLTVTLLVLGAVVATGIVGYLIDKSAESGGNFETKHK